MKKDVIVPKPIFVKMGNVEKTDSSGKGYEIASLLTGWIAVLLMLAVLLMGTTISKMAAFAFLVLWLVQDEKQPHVLPWGIFFCFAMWIGGSIGFKWSPSDKMVAAWITIAVIVLGIVTTWLYLMAIQIAEENDSKEESEEKPLEKASSKKDDVFEGEFSKSFEDSADVRHNWRQ